MIDETLNKLISFIVDSTTISIVGKANTVQSSIDQFTSKQSLLNSEKDIIKMIASGETTVVEAELNSFKSAIGNMLDQVITQAFQTGLQQWIKENDSNGAKYRWNTHGDRHCPDCQSRDGQVKTMDEWELIGLPCSGFSVCDSNCNCTIDPV